MKKARFTEEQMVAILREADRSPIAEVAKKHKISEQTIYVWRRRFGKLEPADVKRLREVETENAKLKRMGVHRAHRLWRGAGLQLPRRRPRRRVATSRPRPLPALAPNQLWAYDFVFDACANGQKLKCLTIIDEFTRECLAIDVAGSIRSKRVIEVLTRLVSQHGAPLFLRSDNVPEFVRLAVLEWLAHAGICTSSIS